MNKFRFALLLAMSALLVAGSLFAQTATTGSIVGTVAQGGTPLPGVTVEVKSSALQGVRTEVTDAKGNFRFSLLAPGDCPTADRPCRYHAARRPVRRRSPRAERHPPARQAARNSLNGSHL